VSYEINVGDKKSNRLPLNLWGSGTQNRTLILDTIFKAKSQKSGNSIYPVLIIEEPESFLHSSAQSQFGRLLQDLAEELKMQIIVATHSIHMLSYQNPNFNLLVDRKKHKGILRESYIRETDKDNWMLPFDSVLGISGAFDKKAKDLIFGEYDVLYVEGETDRRYVEIFQEEGLVVSQNLRIIEMGGAPNWINEKVLDIFKQHNRNMAFLLDKDKEGKAWIKGISDAGIKIIWVGGNSLQDIEGIVPEKLLNEVLRKNPSVARETAYGGTQKNIKKIKLKKLTLAAFEKSTDKRKFNGFKPIIKEINECFSKPSNSGDKSRQSKKK